MRNKNRYRLYQSDAEQNVIVNENIIKGSRVNILGFLSKMKTKHVLN